MTQEQTEAVDRVKAAYAALNDSEFESGTFRTEDVKALIDSFEELEAKVEFVKEDLAEIRNILQNNGEDDNSLLMELVNSTLMLLNDSDF
jgi:hypothetical protein